MASGSGGWPPASACCDLDRHQLLHGGDHVVRQRRVRRRLEPPRLLGVEVDVAQQRRRAPAFGGDQPGVDVGAAELLDLHQLGGVVLALEHPHRRAEPVRPAGSAVAMAGEGGKFVVDEGDQAVGQLLGSRVLGNRGVARRLRLLADEPFRRN